MYALPISKKQDTVYDPVSRLAQAIENQSIVLEGVCTQLYLLREELVRNRMAKDDVLDNDVVFKTLVADQIYDIVHPESNNQTPEGVF